MSKRSANKRSGFSCKELIHGIATILAVCGLGLIIAAPLDYAVYGIALFGLAIALYVIVAANCQGRTRYRFPVSHW